MTQAPVRMPVGGVLAAATEELTRAGVGSPRHDAEVLAAHVLGLARTALLMLDADAFEPVRPMYEAAIRRRAAREPLQHIVGTAPFRHLELAVGPGVLIPRPESELLVDAALAYVAAQLLAAPRIADLGTGSGALALSVAKECPGARVWAVERDADALSWAARNVADNRLAVTLVAGDLCAALSELDGTLDVVLANPPYLPLELAPQLEPEVRDHDPVDALFAGADPLAAVRAVESAARRLLRPGGLVVVEHGDDQGSTAPNCFRAHGGHAWTQVSDHRDLAGRPRYLTAVRA